MLTLKSLLKTYEQNAAFGQTGKHVLGRGFERTDGSFTEEVLMKQTNKTPEIKPEGPK